MYKVTITATVTLAEKDLRTLFEYTTAVINEFDDVGSSYGYCNVEMTEPEKVEEE